MTTDTLDPAAREILTSECGRAYAAIRRWHPGLPEDPHPAALAALEAAFVEAFRRMASRHG
jgi:hypothetical protein